VSGLSVEIRNHRIFVNGAQVPYRQTPNGGKSLDPSGIILHDTAGDLPGTGSVSWLCNPDSKASAHVVIGYDGKITQLQALNRQCWHAGASQYRGRSNCNAFTIGIEIANPGAMSKQGTGYSNNPDPKKGVKVSSSMPVRKASSPNHGPAYWLEYSDAQVEAVTELCRAITAEYGTTFITTHWDICLPKGRKVDTNPLFPLDQVRRSVFGGKPAKVAEISDESGESDDSDMEMSSQSRPGFIRRWWGKLTGGTVLGGSAFGGLAALTDWQIALIVFGFLLVLLGVALWLLFYLFDAPELKAWIKRKVG